MGTRKTVFLLALSALAALYGCGSSLNSAVSPPSTGPTAFSISITPTSAPVGSGDLSLVVSGSHFESAGAIQSQVVWSANGHEVLLATTVVSSTQLTAVVPSALLADAVSAQVSVQALDQVKHTVNSTSNIVAFSVFAAKGQLAISSISPNTVVVGGSDVQLTVIGSSFQCSGSPCHDEVVWSVQGHDVDLTWNFVSETQLTTTIPATLLASPVTAEVRVQQWHKADESPYAVSNLVSFTVAKSGSNISSKIAPTGSMGAARSGHTATVLSDGKVILAGGGNSSAELFDPATAAFLPTGAMSVARSGAAASLLADGKVLVAGGSDANGTSLASAETFDAATGRFTPVGGMLNTRTGATATLLPSGKVLITGGVDRNNSILDTAELYDPNTTTFTFAAGSMLVPRWGHTATLLADGKVLLTGGRVSFTPNINSTTAEVFDPAASTFAATGSMATGRNFHSAILLNDGRVLILGGNASLFSLSSGELYDPASGQFTPTGNLQMAREFHTATALPSGKVLVTGGVNWFSGPDAPESQILSSAELFDPVAGTSASIGNLENERVGHTATLLKDGRALIAGGHDSEKNLATAEIYK
jgi:hypothetical protein